MNKVNNIKDYNKKKSKNNKQEYPLYNECKGCNYEESCAGYDAANLCCPVGCEK